ncbi:MAG TPA: fasciclin domain-containing protein [Pseudonocardiaceae bacterium]|nr:fasciclin domain-containing protein [Pseudonocardiaceae bacterium]
MPVATGQGPATGNQAGEPPTTSAQAAPNPGAATPSTNGVTQISDIFGPACDQVPKQGPGSAQGMVNDPVATAASNNSLLTTLTKAVKTANLVDTLNSAPALTVFAPSDPAFQQLDAQHPGTVNQLTTALASPDSKLAKILKYHVVGQRYDAAGLVQAGTVETLARSKIDIGGTPSVPTVNGAQVLCGNIPTENATVFVIGQVLTPPAT